MENSLHKLMGEDYSNCIGRTEKDGYLAFKVRYDKFRCSECGFTTKFTDGHTAQYKYCPQCGRRIDWSGEDET